MPPLIEIEQSVEDESDGNEVITIDNLRKNKHLKAKVHKLMKQFALNDKVEDSNSAESNSSYFESEKSDRDSDDGKKKKKVKSGRNEKAADRVSILSDGLKLTVCLEKSTVLSMGCRSSAYIAQRFLMHLLSFF